MKRHLARLAILCVLAALAVSALHVSGVGAQAAPMITVLGRLGPRTISAALGLSILSALLSGAVCSASYNRLSPAARCVDGSTTEKDSLVR